MNSVGDEIVIEILNKASLKSLHRLKWVSKSWYSLIYNEVLLHQLVKSPNPCIYYCKYHDNGPRSFLSVANPNRDHISLDFLPRNYKGQSPNVTILDTCNGLIFCRFAGTFRRYFVCNPVDKTYNEISPIFNPHSLFYVLDFNPLKSPHYRILLVQGPDSSGALQFNVYHSANHCFEKVVHVRPPHLFYIYCKESNLALCNEYVYLDCGFEGDPRNVSECKVMKISGVLHGADQNISYKFIKFPQGSCRNRECCSYMHTWRGKLRFVSISPERITMFALGDNHEDEWTLEHDSAAIFLFLSQQSWENNMVEQDLYIVGFHPIRNLLLIMFKRLLYAYDFDQFSFEKISDFENHRVLDYSVFSFTPCFAKQVLA